MIGAKDFWRKTRQDLSTIEKGIKKAFDMEVRTAAEEARLHQRTPEAAHFYRIFLNFLMDELNALNALPATASGRGGSSSGGGATERPRNAGLSGSLVPTNVVRPMTNRPYPTSVLPTTTRDRIATSAASGVIYPSCLCLPILIVHLFKKKEKQLYRSERSQRQRD